MLGLHDGLLSMGVESWILTARKVLEVKNCVVASADVDKKLRLKELASELIWRNRAPVSNTHFSLDCEGAKIWDQPLVREADIIHLHWVSGILSSSSIAGFALLGKPVIWTLHDMRPLTGGCHFSAGCMKYQEECGSCIQLKNDTLNITRRSLLGMRAATALLKPWFVAPSSWMHQVVLDSSVARTLSSSCIPYGVDTDLFRPGSRDDARNTLGLALDADYILLASHSMVEKRKGASHALEILNALAKDPSAQSRIASGKLRLLICGHPSKDFAPKGWVVDHTGYQPASEMHFVYQSANIMLFTSTEDNLPNVILESMACGLPVVAHSVGGVPDLLGFCCNEMLFAPGDTKHGAQLVLRSIQDSQQLTRIGGLCSEHIRAHYTLAKQASSYCDLYRNMMQQPKDRTADIYELVQILETKEKSFFDECRSVMSGKSKKGIFSKHKSLINNKFIIFVRKIGGYYKVLQKK
jgi:glycosyltransferase involved in cell wall biosynthesis